MTSVPPQEAVRASAAPPQRRRARKATPFTLLAVLPFLLFGLVFAVYPMSQVVRMALSDVQISSGQFEWTFTGAENLAKVLGAGVSWEVIGNTVVFVVASVLVSIVLGLALALLVDRAITLLPLARNVLIWPAVIAPVVVSLMWLLILSPTAGGLNKLLRTLSLPEQGWLGDGGSAMAAVVVVDVWHWTPVVFLFFYTALKAIDASTLEAARMDGANEREIVRYIILPALRPTVMAVALVRIIMGVKVFDEMYLLTQGGPDGATTLVSQHIKSLFFDSLRLGEAASYSLVVVFATAIVLGVVLFVRSRMER